MTRDFELHVYFAHRQLTATSVTVLLGGLARAGLSLGEPPGERFPALASFDWDDVAPRLKTDDVETLLRTKEPPVGAGYGILPLRVARPSLPADHPAFLSFGRPDPGTDLDSVSLVVDGALFRSDEDGALTAAFEWFTLLCDWAAVYYGWGDWETATFLVAAPSRRDVRAATIPRLMRFNALGPALAPRFASAEVERSTVRSVRLASGAWLFEPEQGIRQASLG